MASVAERLTSIVARQQVDKIIPFLQKIKEWEKERVIVVAKKLIRQTTPPVSDEQLYILQTIAFVCFTKRGFEKYIGQLRADVAEPVLSWYVPEWLAEFINETVVKEGTSLECTYEQLMTWSDKGYLKEPICPEVIVQLLYKTPYLELEKREVTLHEHVWLLFEYETALNTTGKVNPECDWMVAFNYYSEKGVLDRFRLFRLSLVTFTKHFNRILTGWFADLFKDLKPTTEELLFLQSDLLSSLSCPYSKPVNMVLDYLKQLVVSPDFKADEFITYSTFLFASDVKTVHLATLVMFSTLAKSNSKLRPAISEAAAAALSSKDPVIQERASKLIANYGSLKSKTLREVLSLYATTMHAGAYNRLEAYLDSTDSVATPGLNLAIQSQIRENMRIPLINNMSELIFLMSQSMENKESYHIDQLLASVVQMHPLVGVEDVIRMVPAFQRAYKVMQEEVEGVGVLDMLIASFLVDYSVRLIRMYDGAVVVLSDLYEEYCSHEKIIQKSKKGYQPPYQDYKGYIDLFRLAMKRIDDGGKLPILSTPTHRPAFIDPLVLISRIAEYQEAKVLPDQMDCQIALSRVALDRTAEAIIQTKKKLTGEWCALLLFLFDKKVRPEGLFKLQTFWMTAALVKTPEKVYEEFADFPYSLGERAYLTGNMPFEVSILKRPTGKSDHVLQINPPEGRNVSVQKRFGGYAVYFNYRSISRQPLLVETFWNMHVKERDAKRLFLLSPNAPQVFLALIVHDGVRDAYWCDADMCRVNMIVLETMKELDYPWGEMSDLYLSLCLLSIHKPTRSCAAALWADRVEKGKLNNIAVGRVLGMLEATEWSPIQRFVALVSEEMINISKLHNRELEKLLLNLIIDLPEKPLRDLRRILEVFADLLALNHSKIANKRLLVLSQKWGKIAKLKSAVAALSRFLVDPGIES